MKTVAELSNLVSDAISNEDEDRLKALSKYFKLGGENRGPFVPAIEFDGSQIAEASEEADIALPLANSISREIRRIRYKRKLRSYDGPIIVSEGDSWEQYPFFLKDTIDWLSETYAVYSLGAAGAKLFEMIAEQEYAKAVADQNADIFFLSAGGNDLLDNARLRRFLRTWDEAGQDPSQVLNRSVFDPFLASILTGYENIATSVSKARPGIQVLLHGYDYALPRKKGPWLGPPLLDAGVPEQYHPKIIQQLIDLLNESQIEFAGRFANVEHIDCRTLVGKSQWKDELHPTDAGYKKVAAKFEQRIEAALSANTRTTSVFSTSEFARIANLQKNTKLSLADFGPAEEAVIGDAALRVIRHVTPPREIVPGFIDPSSARPTETEEHPCSSLRAWHANLDPEDFTAFGHYKELLQKIHEPDTNELMSARKEILSGAGHTSIERILGESNIYQAAFLARGARASKSVGRITIINRHGAAKGHGTGFLVAPGLLMTNHHVLSDIELTERSFVLFDYEYDVDDNFLVPERYNFDPSVFFTDQSHDFTFVGVQPRSLRQKPIEQYGHLVLVANSGKALKKEYVSIIQHGDGLPKQVAIRDSQILGRKEQYVYYTTDTNYGSSGGPVVNDDWFPVAIHHRTVPDVANPCRYVANRGIRISSVFERLKEMSEHGDSDAADILSRLDERPPSTPQTPFNIDPSPISEQESGASTEAFREPFHEADYSNRRGYAPDFLGRRIPMPQPRDSDLAAPLLSEPSNFVLDYQHFSIVMHKQRRLAMLTAANIDTSDKMTEPEPGRDYTRDGLGGLREHDRERWFLDPRISPEHQLPDRFFEKDRQSFDKGHLVRRDIAAWGDTYAMVRRANGDTFHTTNCSPQVKGFNRSNFRGEWGLLENKVASGADEEKLCIFSGPVLHPRDRRFSGLDDRGRALIRIPSRYWKIIVARNGRKIECYPFLLIQDLSDTELEFSLPDKWLQKMSSMKEVAAAVPYLVFPDILFDADIKS